MDPVDADMTDDAHRVALRSFVAEHHRGVLATIKRDGRPQLSNVVYALGDDDLVRISVTEARAKTRNLRRDPRASLHVTTPDFWPYAVAEGDATLSPVATDPHDPTVEELVALYRAVSGEHDDWEEFRGAMVAERRLVVRIPLGHLYGTAGG